MRKDMGLGMRQGVCVIMLQETQHRHFVGMNCMKHKCSKVSHFMAITNTLHDLVLVWYYLDMQDHCS